MALSCAALSYAALLVLKLANGEDIICRVAVKPPSSITKSQDTVTKNAESTKVEVHGRHDPCICPRVVPVVESMMAIAILDCLLIQKAMGPIQ